MKNYKSIAIISVSFLISALLVSGALLVKKDGLQKGFSESINPLSIKPVSAQEIYPLFFCPCCGQPLNPKKICCGLAKERIDYINSLVDLEIPKDKIVLAYVKKYGLNSFLDKEKQNEFRDKLAQQAPADRPIISLSSDNYDFGDVSQKKGVVMTFFEIKNIGKSNLVIDKLETSCGCTSASIIYQGKEGPRFAMAGHGINEKISNWQVSIAPGKTAQLKVYYDPNVHKDFRGPAIRTISIFSNDPIDFEKKVKIELNQTR